MTNILFKLSKNNLSNPIILKNKIKKTNKKKKNYLPGEIEEEYEEDEIGILIEPQRYKHIKIKNKEKNNTEKKISNDKNEKKDNLKKDNIIKEEKKKKKKNNLKKLVKNLSK